MREYFSGVEEGLPDGMRMEALGKRPSTHYSLYVGQVHIASARDGVGGSLLLLECLVADQASVRDIFHKFILFQKEMEKIRMEKACEEARIRLEKDKAVAEKVFSAALKIQNMPPVEKEEKQEAPSRLKLFWR